MNSRPPSPVPSPASTGSTTHVRWTTSNSRLAIRSLSAVGSSICTTTAARGPYAASPNPAPRGPPIFNDRGLPNGSVATFGITSRCAVTPSSSDHNNAFGVLAQIQFWVAVLVPETPVTATPVNGPSPQNPSKDLNVAGLRPSRRRIVHCVATKAPPSLKGIIDGTACELHLDSGADELAKVSGSSTYSQVSPASFDSQRPAQLKLNSLSSLPASPSRSPTNRCRTSLGSTAILWEYRGDTGSDCQEVLPGK